MLSVSYFAVAAAMLAATLYLFFRMRLFLTTATMLIGALLIIYGPAYLTFMLSSGEREFLFRWLSGEARQINEIFPRIEEKVADFNAVVIAMNFSVALMYVSIIATIETLDRLTPNRTALLRARLIDWNSQNLRDDVGGCKILFGVISIVVAFMFFVSIREDHIGTIREFLSLTKEDSSRVAFRLYHGGSHNYIYNVILGAIAPMLVIWGFLAGWLHKKWWLLLSASLLFLAVIIGKSETVSKAVPAFFLIQLMVAGMVAFSNRVNWRSAIGAASFVTLVIYGVFRLVVRAFQGLGPVYSRVFEAESQSLLENFATYPFLHPHMWGANIRPLAMLMGVPYFPAYSTVAYTWYGTYDVTSPSLFIADAWADFSYGGVIIFSVIASAVCRSIDLVFLSQGKTIVSVAILGAAFMGVFTLLITALNTALFSGGLLLAPALAGLLVVAIRYFDPRRGLLPIENAALKD